ncbi:Protein CBG02718 [Caenorhabditis briggsae]|uniref:GH18 domain-containing protein n=2 Tax=Caenorhabditis briggsae TaxID=6238 RepID=A0AAE9J8D7_CAEBR|nr:Protein CBG02718 [Caenorhabditis briggsae]ULU06439.1 hypothetical protein L3Y34_018352 [Caenorhabditis briggsae]UMM18388.1 hypothetical protein L5515_014476 [Caenorhabditis briggsae]CAP23846.1 Protein CBG02718 [Caenorhabditis briggsae]
MISQSKNKPQTDVAFSPIYSDYVHTNSKPKTNKRSWYEYCMIICMILLVIGFLIKVGIMMHKFSLEEKIDVEMSTKGPVTRRNTSKPSACKKRVVGYYTEFESVDITKHQLSKLTHAVFAYAEMRYNGELRFKSEKSENRFMSLKNKAKSSRTDLKVMIGIGGYGNSDHFHNVTRDSVQKKYFINNITEFLQKNEVDGVDLYWKEAQENDKWKYIEFVRDLKKKLKEEERDGNPYLISLTIPPPNIANWEMAYDLEESLEDVDFFNVYSMDYQGPWENQWGNPAGPIAQLYNTVEGRTQFSVDATIKYFVCKTKQPNKFNIAIPFFARLWRHVKETVEPGKEVIRNVELKDNKAVGDAYLSRWTVEDRKYKLSPATWDEESKSSYIYKPETKTYLTFEDQKSIDAKIEYVNSMNLGGVWIWTVEMDDDQNSLLNMVSSTELCSSKSINTIKHSCKRN